MRAIPLPHETVETLRTHYGLQPIEELRFRLRLQELDRVMGVAEADYMTENELRIEDIVLEGEWPEC